MDKVICITSCVSFSGVNIEAGFIAYTFRTEAFKWISLYSKDVEGMEYYLGAVERSNFCRLDDWRDSRMSSILD